MIAYPLATGTTPGGMGQDQNFLPNTRGCIHGEFFPDWHWSLNGGIYDMGVLEIWFCQLCSADVPWCSVTDINRMQKFQAKPATYQIPMIPEMGGLTWVYRQEMNWLCGHPLLSAMAPCHGCETESLPGALSRPRVESWKSKGAAPKGTPTNHLEIEGY
jgi:hypothetical protein